MYAKRHTALNLVIEAMIFLTVLGMIGTGLVMHFVLPVQTSDSLHRGWSLWGYGLHSWGTVHFDLAMTVIVLLLIHLALHWNWLCNVAHRWVHRRAPIAEHPDHVVLNGYGVALVLLVVLALTVFMRAAFSGLDTTGTGERDRPSVIAQRMSQVRPLPATPAGDRAPAPSQAAGH